MAKAPVQERVRTASAAVVGALLRARAGVCGSATAIRPREFRLRVFENFARATSGRVQRHGLEARLAGERE
jgi:hypothetical protein